MRILGLVVMTACTSTHHSSLGPYVTDVRPVAGALQVDSCAIQFTKTTTYGDNDVCLNLLGVPRTSSHSELAAGPCWRQQIPTAGSP